MGLELDRSRRSPFAATLLSFGLPGLGEVYAGQPRAAALTFVVYYCITALSVALLFVPLPGLLADLPIAAGPLCLVFLAVRATRAARRAPQPYLLQPYNRWYWYVVALLLSVFVWQRAVLRTITTWWVEAYRIPSAAMIPTILPGDFVLVSRIHADRVPARNDLVVVATPGGAPLFVLKRVVGLGGDTLSMRKGVLTRNDAAIDEPYMQLSDSSAAAGEDLHEGRAWQLAHLVPTRQRDYRPTMRDWGPIVVPHDSLFVLGDNRDESFDSRFWGAISTRQVRGHPLVVYFSLNPDGIGPLPIRWGRIGRRF